ncbi:hypothetical protein HJFPF1_00563 [Paramyrothecium foliicola]|nr:hypothetical protein HJFPF1_00563 [Paramyrothecium foliicola]
MATTQTIITTSTTTSARPFRHAHAPPVSSPLNPNRNASTAAASPASTSPPTTAKSTPAHIKRRSKSSRKYTPVSPTQKLLRQKAADAWRAELLRRQAARCEARKVQALAAQKAMEARIQKILQEAPAKKQPAGVPGCANEPQPYAFHMPDVGFFTPTKVVLAMGLMRRSSLSATAPSLANDSFLRVPMTA